jgi:phasin family protein
MSTQSKSTKAASKTAAPAAAAASETVEQAVEQAVETVKEQVDKASAAATQGYDDFTALQKNAFDALVRSGEILAKGAEALGKEYFAFAQDSATANSEAAKSLLTARSLQEVVDLQSRIVRVNFDKSVDESGKLSEMSLKIASEAFEPLQKQISVAVEAAMKPLST